MAKKKILIVEDDNIIGMEIRDRIESLGFDVTNVVPFGEDAIKDVAGNRPDLILMDIRLKGKMDGIQTAKKIREFFDIPVVYLTAYADYNTLQRAKITEPFGYVLKPFEERELASIIEMALYKHKMEKKLKESERWLSTTLKSIGDGVITTDTKGRIIFMNAVAEELTGWKQKEALEKDLIDIFNIIDEETRERIDNPVYQILAAGTGKGSSDRTLLVGKNGTERPILDTASPIINEKGETTGAVLVFQDNTERRNAQRKLALQNKYNQLRASLWKLAADKSLTEDELVQKTVDLLGSTLEVCRVSFNKLYGNYLENGEFKCILEWNREGVKSALGASLPAKVVNYFLKEKIQVVDRVAAMEKIPKSIHIFAKPIITSFEKLLNLESVLIVPFYIEKELNAIISFDICQDRKEKFEWSDDMKSVILEATEIVAMFITQKRTEDDLRISEERFRTIFETTPDSMFIKDQFLNYTHVNPAMVKLCNKAFQEVIGLKDDELFGNEEAAILNKADRKVLQGKIIKEEYSKEVNGTLMTFDTVKVPLRNEKGKIVGLCGISRDITQRKKVEKIQQVLYEISNAVNITKNLHELFKSIQNYLVKVIDVTNFFIALYNKENDTISLPYHVDEKDRFKTFPMGKTVTRYIIEHKQSLLATTEKIMELAKTSEIEIIGEIPKIWLGVPLKSGADVIGVIVVQSYKNANLYTNEHLEILEIISGQIALAIDRKRTEEERVRLATAIENAAEGVLIMDENATTLYVNPAFEKITGFSLEESKGKIPRFLKGSKPKEKYNPEIWSRISAGQIWRGSFSNKRKDNKSYEEEITISPIRDDFGKICNFVAIRRDVTEQKRLSDQLRQSKKLEAIGTLAGGIAHDFNNIIGAISGFTELLMDDVTEDRSRKNLQHILKATHRAKDLVQQILTFSRMSENERKPLQVSSIVKETLKLLRASLPATIEINHDIQAEKSLILADPIQIHSLLMNLCTNAHHAMRQTGGTLEVSVTDIIIDNETAQRYQELKPGNYIRITVSDTGTGIDPEIMDRIFDPYFTTKEVGEGSGMGLALVHSIVKNHHGEITVYSELGKGTTISVLLPSIQTKIKEPKKIVEKPIRGGSETILFVDDEKNLVQVSKQRLERLGYAVIGTTSSPEALEIFSHNPHIFDLIITDQTMPKMTGAELAQKMLKIRPDIPIILATGFSELVSKERSKALGISEFIMKPLFSDEIADLVRRVLDNNSRSKR